MTPLILSIIMNRCSMCHSSMGDRNWEKIENIMSHKEKLIEKLSDKSMPPGNATNMTDEERKTLLDWLKK